MSRLKCCFDLFLALSQSLHNKRAVWLQRTVLVTLAVTMASIATSAEADELTALSFELETAQATSAPSSDPALTFQQSSAPQVAMAEPEASLQSVTPEDPIPAQWWVQGASSPIAVAIGHAEGTRQANGAKNVAYYWHRDPGNGVDNFGTFSYQHFSLGRISAVQAESSAAGKRQVAAAQSLPEIADQSQMHRLRRFYGQLQQQAQQREIVLTPLEVFNGLDLINQSEAAGLAEGGYIDRLVKMRSLEADDPEEQIKEARSWAYWHPERKAWDAPGLGNSYRHIRRDQTRRFEAVKRAMETYIPGGKTLVAQSPVGGEKSFAAQQSMPQDNWLGEAAKVTQADALSFSLSRLVAFAGLDQ